MRTSAPLSLFIPLVWLAACESSEQVALDMERALVESNTALVGALVGSEILSHAFDEPTVTTPTLRHGTSLCGCPCIERIGESLPYLLTLDYSDGGCVPTSRLLPTALTGHAVLEFDGTDCQVTFDGLQFALEHPISGELTGSVSSGTAIAPRGAITIGEQTMEVTLDVSIDPSASGGIVFDGEIAVASSVQGEDPRPVQLDAVSLPFDALAPPCPTPVSGTATQIHDRDKKSSIVRFDTPGDGFVTVERDGRVSEPADWCAYASDLW